MKVFKTIVWTSLFWIVALVGVWGAAFWRTEVKELIQTILPTPVWSDFYERGKHVGYEMKLAECECNATPSEAEQTEPAEQLEQAPEVMIETEETPSQASVLTPTPQTELEQLQTRLTELENNHWALVKELQTIFSSPAAQSLLPAPIPVAEAPAAQ